MISTSHKPSSHASSITGTISKLFMPIAESSTANEERQQHKEEEEINRGKEPLAAPSPTPMSPRSVERGVRGFHADDEEKGESRDAVSPDASSLPQGGSSTPSTKKSRKKKKKQEERNLTPSANPTVLERLKPALVLENSGSTARDHLASERTFLAYVRTSLALAGTGVALVQLFTISDLASQRYDLPATAKHLQQFSRPLGTTTILFAIIVLLIGLTRYFTVQTSLIRGTFPTARSSIVFITIVLLMITIIVFVVLLVGRKG